MNVIAMRHPSMNEMIVTHQFRHIFMPINQNIKKIYLQHNNLLIKTIQSNKLFLERATKQEQLDC